MRSITVPCPKDPTGMARNDFEEAKVRIAATLNTVPRLITLERYEIDPSGWAFRCIGDYNGKRFFAKLYLHKFNPPLRRIPRFIAPKEEIELLSNSSATFGGNVEKERLMGDKARSLTGDAIIPHTLASSSENGTLVLEELVGVGLHRHTRLMGNCFLGESISTIRKAAAWLKKLHSETSTGYDEVSPAVTVRSIQRILDITQVRSSRYGDETMRLLDDYSRGRNVDSFAVPRCQYHGDFSLPNLILASPHRQLGVIDFEHSGFGNILYDLCGFIFNLRSQLLYPLSSVSTVTALETAFWSGYGTPAPEIVAMVNVISTSRLFYYFLPRLLKRRERRGRIAGLEAALYIRLLEPWMARRTLRHSSQSLAIAT